MLPIRVRQFPNFLQQMVKRSFVLRRKLPEKPIFRLCYFSCQSYFSYLYCALHSLGTTSRDIKYKVLVFNDTDQPLSGTQIEALRTLVPGIEIIPWPKSMGWGATQIEWIWRAYAFAAEGAADNDVIARVDSDVFFLNNRIFRLVERSNADLVGDGHYVNFQYCQGGCYFFRVSAVRKIVALLENKRIEDLLSGIPVMVEDIAAYQLAKILNLKISLTWYMMFPDELRNAGNLGPWERWKFSCIHFVMKNKAAMLRSYENEIKEKHSIDEFRSLINIQ